MIILDIIDKTYRTIYLTQERYKHIMKHPIMHNKIELIKETLQNPLKITDYLLEEDVKHYYKDYKDMESKAKYMRVIVKYLNGKGFIITAYFVEYIR